MFLSASVVVLAGCAVFGDVRDPTPPPDAVQIRVYTNGGIGGPWVEESVHWTFQSPGSGPESGVVTHVPEATCITVGADWLPSVNDDGAAIPLARSRHDQFSGQSPLNLMIDRDPSGRVTVSEGLPAWMNDKPVGCASLEG